MTVARFGYFRGVLSLIVLGLCARCAAAQNDTANVERQICLTAGLIDQAEDSIKRGTDWLMRQQAPDGGWHSATYAQLRGGDGNTALILYALAHLPKSETERLKPHIDRGVRFLVSNLAPDGSVRAIDGSSDYPTYSTALTLLTIERLHLDGWQMERRRMRAYLQAMQKRGEKDQLERGGWGQTGGPIADVGMDDPASVAATQFALEALQQSGGLGDDTCEAALAFLSHCQNFGAQENHDGGFFFTPLPDDPLNKAGSSPSNGASAKARSYGTATADGFCGLIACGVSIKDPRVQAALNWLRRNNRVDVVPGFTSDDANASSAKNGLQFYYYAALTRGFEKTPQENWTAQRTALLEAVIRQQRPDGSWSNPYTLMREDDPLVATALAIAAISTAANDGATAK